MFEVFFIITCSKMIGCWCTSLVQLLIIGWVMVGLLGNPTQLLCNELSLIITACFSTPLCYSYLTISMKKLQHRHSSCCKFLTLLVLTNSLSLNTCSNYWLQVVTTFNTLTKTLSILRQFRWRHGIRTNKFSSEHILYFKFFTTFFGSMFYARTNYTWIINMYFSWFNRLGFCPCYTFCRLNYNSWHNWYLFFLLWQISIEWSILPELVQVNVDLAIIVSITCLTTMLTSSVFNITL